MGCGSDQRPCHSSRIAEAPMDEAEFLSRLIVPALLFGIVTVALVARRLLIPILGGGLVGLLIVTGFILFYVLGPESARDWVQWVRGYPAWWVVHADGSTPRHLRSCMDPEARRPNESGVRSRRRVPRRLD